MATDCGFAARSADLPFRRGGVWPAALPFGLFEETCADARSRCPIATTTSFAPTSSRDYPALKRRSRAAGCMMNGVPTCSRRSRELEDYYPTRAETAILRARQPELQQFAGPGSILIEYGAGAGVKTELVLESLAEPRGYVPSTSRTSTCFKRRTGWNAAFALCGCGLSNATS